MSTRTGKIARLPREIREQLNRRLADGELQTHLVDWLNSLPEVEAVLKANFKGQPISEQNLSEWKQGGYRDWGLHQEIIGLVRQMDADADELNQAGKARLPDLLAQRLTAHYVIAAKVLSQLNAEGEIDLKSSASSARTLSRCARATTVPSGSSLNGNGWSSSASNSANCARRSFRNGPRNTATKSPGDTRHPRKGRRGCGRRCSESRTHQKPAGKSNCPNVPGPRVDSIQPNQTRSNLVTGGLAERSDKSRVYQDGEAQPGASVFPMPPVAVRAGRRPCGWQRAGVTDSCGRR